MVWKILNDKDAMLFIVYYIVIGILLFEKIIQKIYILSLYVGFLESYFKDTLNQTPKLSSQNYVNVYRNSLIRYRDIVK